MGKPFDFVPNYNKKSLERRNSEICPDPIAKLS